MTANSVVQDWLLTLTYKQQTVLLAGFRGCDGRVKEDPSKYFTRLLRSAVLKNADSSTTFMAPSYEDFDKRKNLFFGDIDSYPMHFLIHFIHAAEIVGYNHPSEDVKKMWLDFYVSGVNALHMYPETKEQNDIRLADPVLQVTSKEPSLDLNGLKIIIESACAETARRTREDILAELDLKLQDRVKELGTEEFMPDIKRGEIVGLLDARIQIKFMREHPAKIGME